MSDERQDYFESKKKKKYRRVYKKRKRGPSVEKI